MAGAQRGAGSPDPAHNRAGDPGARSVTRRARANIVRDTRIAFTRAFRPAACLVQVVTRRPLGAETHREGQRNRHRLVPARRGARAPLACEDRRLVGCARASYRRLQKSASVAEAQRSAYPVATGHVDGSRAGRPERASRSKAATTWQRGGKAARVRRRPEPGARKGVAGRRSLSVQKAHRAAPPTRTASRGRAGSGLGDSHSGEGRDRGVRSASAHIARGRQRPPRRTRNR